MPFVRRAAGVGVIGGTPFVPTLFSGLRRTGAGQRRCVLHAAAPEDFSLFAKNTGATLLTRPSTVALSDLDQGGLRYAECALGMHLA
jgi:hypothetical protein